MTPEIALYWLIANEKLYRSDLTGNWHTAEGALLGEPIGVTLCLNRIADDLHGDDVWRSPQKSESKEVAQKSERPIVPLDGDGLPLPSLTDEGKSPPFSAPVTHAEADALPQQNDALPPSNDSYPPLSDYLPEGSRPWVVAKRLEAEKAYPEFTDPTPPYRRPSITDGTPVSLPVSKGDRDALKAVEVSPGTFHVSRIDFVSSGDDDE